jgi:DNA sulfur modification protein DndB
MVTLGAQIRCMTGRSAGRDVILGFAAASLLHRLSFADVLNEDTLRGYQRRLNSQHSLDFRRYIQLPASSTIPLTFNLRPERSNVWRLREAGAGCAILEVDPDDLKVLAQVDCQHRIGNLADSDLELPFMSFIGLTDREEMEIFNVINSKARGLSSSLLDFHDAQLTADLGADRPELYIALSLRHEPTSPWHRQLDLGGSTSGLARRASLRTIQKAVKRFLARTRVLDSESIDTASHIVLDFWTALVTVLPVQWSNPRKHLLTKGVGVYALMELAADLYGELKPGRVCDRKYFAAALSDFAIDFDWTTDGPLRGLGGEGGVKSAVEMVRAARRSSRLRIVRNAK